MRRHLTSGTRGFVKTVQTTSLERSPRDLSEINAVYLYLGGSASEFIRRGGPGNC